MRLVRLLSVLLLVVACINVPVQSQTAVASTPVQRITAPIDETNLAALPGNVHPLAQARFDLGVAPGSMATGRILLVLQRSAAQQQALTQYLADVQNPSSPSFHKWLTPAQYGAAYGIGDSDLQTVESWLEANGFKIEKVPQGRNVIQFSGTVSQIASAFH
ncbi:MAG: protease pro-enzyme activation domain-containing protein, partial [Acidobacteriaceae bacterium]